MPYVFRPTAKGCRVRANESDNFSVCQSVSVSVYITLCFSLLLGIQSTPSIQKISKLSRGHCNYGQVTCRSYRYCIPESYECDVIVDCSDGSDEDHCNSTLSTGML